MTLLLNLSPLSIYLQHNKELVVPEIIENTFNIDINTIFAVTFRTTILTLLIVFVIKWLGKGLGQISSIELIMILDIGNAVIEPMVIPTEVSILQGLMVIIIAITIFKMYDYLTTRYKKFSKVILANPILLVKDGENLKRVYDVC